ncbi:MAG: twin-arginine translocase subunit TatB [Gammaproteobacteria bacterium]|nr:twin-arginine translocase subunit TatB [Gammaproteobacteria bacterium]
MFDMGFTELIVIGIVGLVILGPERLPKVARTAGKYFGKLRRFMSSVKADVESELRSDELREIFEKQSEELQSLKKVVDDVGKDVGESVSELEASVNQEDSAVAVDKNWAESLVEQPKAIKKATKPRATKPKAARAKPKTARAKTAKAKPKARKVTAK